ncbi:MAG: hypothetical protein M0Z55_09890 [Peptococcaceae bacterium]|nr:hypothetical protein [Peptococcaceae bacterium]
MLTLGLIMLLPVFTAMYTLSFGLYNWRQGNKSGAVGIYILACSCVGFPFLVMLLKQ